MPFHGQPKLRQVGDFRILRRHWPGRHGRRVRSSAGVLGPACRLGGIAADCLPKRCLQRALSGREARAAARLHHTNIVPVFGVGEDQGVLYYAMQFIQGRALDTVLDDVKRMCKLAAPQTRPNSRRRSPKELRRPTACSQANSKPPIRNPEPAPRPHDSRRGSTCDGHDNAGSLRLGHAFGPKQPARNALLSKHCMGWRAGRRAFPAQGASHSASRHQALEPAPRCPWHSVDHRFWSCQGSGQRTSRIPARFGTLPATCSASALKQRRCGCSDVYALGVDAIRSHARAVAHRRRPRETHGSDHLRHAAAGKRAASRYCLADLETIVQKAVAGIPPRGTRQPATWPKDLAAS